MGNIVITEAVNNDIASFADFFLSAPADFEFKPSTGTVTFTAGRNITSASIIISPTSITVTLAGSGTSLIDAITISGIQVRGITGAAGPQTILRGGGTSLITGHFGLVHATLTSVLNSVTAGVISGSQTICSGGNPNIFTETTAATGSGTLTYSWRKSTDGFSGQLATTPTYDVPGALAVTTDYNRITTSTLSSVACSVTTNLIGVKINEVTGGYVSTPQTICYNGDPLPFTETVASTGTGPLTYQWKHSIDGYTTATLGINATYNVPPGLTTPTTYRRITTSTLGSVACTANSSSDIPITIMPVVTGGPLSAPQTICSGSTPSQLTGPTGTGGDGNYTYLWQQSTVNSTTGFTPATFTNTTVNYSPTALSDTTWYRRKVSSAGCNSTDSAAIKMTVEIPLVTNPPTFITCSGAQINIGLTSNVPSNFTWTIGSISGGISGATTGAGNNIIQTLTNPSNTTAGSLQYIITPTSTAGLCVGTSFTITVTVNPSPELSSTSPSPICSGEPFNYTALSLTPGATFSWTRAVVAGISNLAGSGIILSETLTNTTAYPVNVTYVYTIVANGCSNTQNVTVTVNPTPTLSSGLTATICSGMIFNYNPTSLTTGATFDWTRAELPGISNYTSNGTNDPNETLEDTTASPVNVNYDFTTAANGCDNTETLVVTVNPAPFVTNVSNDTSCSGADPNITLTANISSTFAWTLGENPGGITGGSNSSGPLLNQILTNLSNSTTYSLQYNVTATSGTCSGNSSAIFINVNPQPLANAGSNSTICSDSSIIIGGSPTAIAGNGPYTYSWSPSSGLDSPTLSNPTANPTISTTYSVTVTDSLGCAASISSMMVTVNASPNVNAGADVSICIGNNITLYASGGTSYLWSNGSITDSITVNPTVSTIYSVMGTTNGCSHSDTVLVTVNPLPVVNGGNDTTICAGQSIVLSGNGNGFPYTWNNGVSDGVSFTPTATTTYVVTGTINGCSQNDTVFVTVKSLPVVNGGNDTTICAGQSAILSGNGNGAPYTWNNGISNGVSFTPTATTTYAVSGILNGCANSDTVLVTVNSLPLVAISASAPICEGQNETLTANGGVLFAWSTGATTNSITVTPATTTTYTVTVTDVNACSDVATATVIVNPAPIANAGVDFTICIGDTASLAGAGGVIYVWTDGTTTFNTSTISASPIASTVYSLSVTDNLGCSAFDTAMVNVTPSKDIFGNVRYSGGPVTNGMAVLYKYVQFQSRFDSVQYVPLNPTTGDYVFNSVNYGEYLVKVFADSASYPTLINTYYGDDFLWDGDSVQVIDHTCASNTILDSITMVELTGTGGGIGLIIGQIIEGISFGRVEGEPIEGVDVKLGKNPGGSIVATTTTDSTGHFTFSGVSNGNYTIYVDIPGLGRDSTYTFTIDSTNNQFVNQNYIADSNSVFMNPTSTVGISNPANAFENKFSVYPNPVIGNTTIEYSILQMTDSKTILEITTVLGVKITSLVNTTQQTGTYKYNFNPQNYQLNSGVYFITLTIDGKTSTKRIVVME
ncbi:MAG: PKD-like domain-containing protein [Bacteroidota bacterium]